MNDSNLILLVIKNMQRDQCSPFTDSSELVLYTVNKTLMNQSDTSMIQFELLTELTFCHVQFRKKLMNQSINITTN